MSVMESFLEQVHLINNKYKELAKVTGDNYNIFKVLQLSSKELSHSKVISNLLNPKGSHGQGDVFLNYFIHVLYDELSEEKDIPLLNEWSKNDFIAKSTRVELEKYIGQISKDHTSGGRIDICISNGSKPIIIIENKIYASNQENQLIRYYNYLKKCKCENEAILLYLTLNGRNADNHKKLEGIKYFPISYKFTISKWLEKCKSYSVEKPFIRETLSQYIYILKSLTGQSRSRIMTDEIIETIMMNKNHVKSAFQIAETIDSLKMRIFKNKLFPKLEEIAHKNGLILKIKGTPYHERYAGFYFQKKEWNNLQLQFEFQETYYTHLIYGLRIDEVKTNINSNNELYSENYWKKNKKWAAYRDFDGYRDWNVDVFLNIIDIDNDSNNNILVKDIEDKLTELIDIAKLLDLDK